MRDLVKMNIELTGQMKKDLKKLAADRGIPMHRIIDEALQPILYGQKNESGNTNGEAASTVKDGSRASAGSVKPEARKDQRAAESPGRTLNDLLTLSPTVPGSKYRSVKGGDL